MEHLTLSQKLMVIEANLLVDLVYPELKGYAPTKNDVERANDDAKKVYQAQLDLEDMHANVYADLLRNLKN